MYIKLTSNKMIFRLFINKQSVRVYLAICNSSQARVLNSNQDSSSRTIIHSFFCEINHYLRQPFRTTSQKLKHFMASLLLQQAGVSNFISFKNKTFALDRIILISK